MRAALIALIAAALVGIPGGHDAEATPVRARRARAAKAKGKPRPKQTSPHTMKAQRKGSLLSKKLGIRAKQVSATSAKKHVDTAPTQLRRNMDRVELKASSKAPSTRQRQRSNKGARMTVRERLRKNRAARPIRKPKVPIGRRVLRLLRRGPVAAKMEAVSAQLLETDADAFAARVDLIQNARTEINVSSFILSADRVGMMVLASLRSAAQRGVKVRVLVDALGSGKIPPGTLQQLSHDGVEIGVYNQASMKNLASLLGISRRMHDKLLIVDGSSLILGARNIDEGYFGGKKQGYAKFVNTDAYLEGGPAARANDYFGEVWSSKEVTPFRAKTADRDARLHARASLEHWGRVLARHGKKRKHGLWRQRNRAPGLGKFVHDPSTSLIAEGGVHDDILGMLNSASHSIDIQTPYMVPTRRVLRALQRATARGVKVTIHTNSLKTIDSKLAQLAYEGQLGRLARTGARIFEYSDAIGLHSKGVTVDGRLSYIGSYNFDPRSAVLNKEVGAILDSRSFAKQMLDHSHRLRARSVEVARDGRITSMKSQTCGIGCRSLAVLLAPVLRFTGLYGQL